MAISIRDTKQMFVSEVYLERLLTSRVPAVEAVFGGLVWIGIVVGFVRDPSVAAWMLSALLGVPLTLRLAERQTAGPTTASITWLRTFAVPAALMSSLPWLTPGPIAFFLSLPWLVLTLLIATTGTFRFLSRRSIKTPMIAMDVGLMVIGLTGIALTLDRLGVGASSNLEYSFATFLVPVIAAECVRRRDSAWWIAASLTLAIPIGSMAVRYGDPARLVGFGIVAATFAAIALLSIRLGTEQTSAAQAGLLSGGVVVGFGAGLLLAAEAFAFFSVTGDALDLMRAFDWPLIAFGLIPVLLGLVLIPAESRPGQRRTFFHLGPPTKEQLSRLNQELEHQEPRAAVNPMAEQAPAGYRLHRITRPVPDFENSCEALSTWAGHDAAGIELTPEHPPILMGKDVVFTIPAGPFTITSTGRIVALISDEDHYGFVYSTLDHHPFVGTEAIILDKSSGQSMLVVSTVWRPNCLATGLLGPIINKVLDRIAGGYMDGIAEAEAATIEARMVDVLSDMNKHHYAVSREAIRAEAAPHLPTATDVIQEEVATQPLSKFEALFDQPLHAPSDEIEVPGEDLPLADR